MKFKYFLQIIFGITILISGYYLFFPTNGFLNRTDIFLIQSISDFITSGKKEVKYEKRDLSKFYNLYYWEKDYLTRPDRVGVLYPGKRNGKDGFFEEKWKGLETDNNHDIAKYEGDIVDGFPIGYGTLTFPEGMYVGEFRFSLMDGHGAITLKNGSKYIGEFRMGKPLNVILYDKDGNILNKLVNGKDIKQ